jgi:hypothetical protein
MQWTRDLYHYEATPPQGSWERINFELENDISGLRKNLKEAEEIPPPAVWEAVKKELYTEDAIDFSIPWYRKLSGWAAAAAITGVLFLTYYLVNTRNYFKPAELATSIQLSESTAVVPKTKISPEVVIPPPSSSGNTPAPAKSTEANGKAQTMEEVAVVAYNVVHDRKPTAHLQYAMVNPEIKPAEIVAPRRIQDNRDYRTMQAVQFHDGNYIQIVSPEGNTTRVSYKLQEMIPAFRNDIDNPVLNKWKSKLQSSAFIPASVNFFDIADMVSLLAEQK